MDIDKKLEHICNRDIKLLREAELVTSDGHLKCTEYGDAMARYYVRFETMKAFLGLKQQARVADVVGVCCQTA